VKGSASGFWIFLEIVLQFLDGFLKSLLTALYGMEQIECSPKTQRGFDLWSTYLATLLCYTCFSGNWNIQIFFAKEYL
jgi:hypothetical protein